LDLDAAREVFEASKDLTVGIEEEWGLVDPATLELVPRFEQLQAAATGDPVLETAISGELISSEIEIRSGRGENVAHALQLQREARRALFKLADAHGVALASTGTHPLSDYREQHIIDTEHYRRVQDGLKYVAWRNNTFALQVHIGIQGGDRAVRVCDRLRPILPTLLAISANSPFLDGRDSGRHSARSQIFTKSFPRCGIPEPFGSFRAYAEYVDFLVRTNSIVEHTQLWWSVRPHHAFGTVEVRICDAQTTAEASTALVGLITAAVAQAATDYDEQVHYDPPAGRLVEENFWRAIRHGLDGKLIDLDRQEEYPAAAIGDRLMAWTAPARSALGIEVSLPAESGSQRQRRALQAGASIEEVYRAEVAETQRTYAGERAIR
jgi:glutamate---cysteine ligase / carboxylate-amine ligase